MPVICYFRKTHCNNCLQIIPTENQCRSFVLCSDCDTMSYCSVECLNEDKIDHSPECEIMDQIWTLPDITRIMLRLLLKLENKKTNQSEILPYSQGERKFAELVSHSNMIDDHDECALEVYKSVLDILPFHCVQSWAYFKDVYGKLIINSFEVSGDDDEKVGWALYLGPSILDHSCVPSAEVDFCGKRILVKSKVNMIDIDLRKIYISYIDIGAPTHVRRNRLKKYYHFDCYCERCIGIKLSWVVSEPFNVNLAEILLQKENMVEAVLKSAKGNDKAFLHSIRCQKCSGRPVQIQEGSFVAICTFCNKEVDQRIVKEYFEIKEAVEKVIVMEQIPADAATQCMELMTGLFYPYDLTYVTICGLAMTDCLLQNKLTEALEFGEILLVVLKKFAKGTPAHIELLLRIMRIQAERGKKNEIDLLVQGGLVDAYNNTELCTKLLKVRDKLNLEYFDRE